MTQNIFESFDKVPYEGPDSTNPLAASDLPTCKTACSRVYRLWAGVRISPA